LSAIRRLAKQESAEVIEEATRIIENLGNAD
jgi:hypothetical protein